MSAEYSRRSLLKLVGADMIAPPLLAACARAAGGMATVFLAKDLRHDRGRM